MLCKAPAVVLWKDLKSHVPLFPWWVPSPPASAPLCCVFLSCFAQHFSLPMHLAALLQTTLLLWLSAAELISWQSRRTWQTCEISSSSCCQTFVKGLRVGGTTLGRPRASPQTQKQIHTDHDQLPWSWNNFLSSHALQSFHYIDYFLPSNIAMARSSFRNSSRNLGCFGPSSVKVSSKGTSPPERSEISVPWGFVTVQRRSKEKELRTLNEH